MTDDLVARRLEIEPGHLATDDGEDAAADRLALCWFRRRQRNEDHQRAADSHRALHGEIGRAHV